MFSTVISILLVYFVIGAVAIFVIRQKKGQGREPWVKFGMYFLIVFSLILSAQYSMLMFRTLIFLIILLGFWEIIRAGGQDDHRFKFIALIVFSFLAFLVFYWVLKVTAEYFVWLYMLVLTFDGFSQISGQLLGKTAIAARVSPGKTLEGFFGGSVMTLLTAQLLVHFFPEPWPAWKYWLCVILIVLAAFGGDLLASLFKRKKGIKDFSALIPGHGGILDRFDSFIAAASVFVLLLMVF